MRSLYGIDGIDERAWSREMARQDPPPVSRTTPRSMRPSTPGHPGEERDGWFFWRGSWRPL